MPERDLNKFSLKSRLGSFKFAFHGLSALLKYQHNSRIHLVAALFAIILGLLLRLNMYEWCLIIIVTGLVFLTELLNSSIEALADHIDPEWQERIMLAKDYSAAAVLVAAIIALLTGGIIFIPKLLGFL